MDRKRFIQANNFEVLWFGIDAERIIRARKILKQQEDERRNALLKSEKQWKRK